MQQLLIGLYKCIPMLPLLITMQLKVWNHDLNLTKDTTLVTVPAVTYPIVKYVKDVELEQMPAPIFNGSIIDDPDKKNGYLLTYRMALNEYTLKRRNQTGIVTLNQNLHIEQQQWLDLSYEYNKDKPLKDQLRLPEDARIFKVNNDLYVVYAASISILSRLFLGTLHKTGDKYVITDINRLDFAPKQHLNQKNWTPFVYNDQIHFIYSADPTLILRWDAQDKKIHFVSEQPYQNGALASAWPYGEIRGGTPAMYISGLNAYLTFFHSQQDFRDGHPGWVERKEPRWRIYYMGAYLFESKPPFKIIAMTTKPLTYDDLYKNAKANYHIIFPCGFVEDEDNFIISSGIDDKKLALLKINKQALYKNMTWLNLEVN